jgi:hypothetical protein
MRTFAALLVLVGHCFVSHTAATAQSQDCKLCRDDYTVCVKAHSQGACKTNYDVCTIVGKNSGTKTINRERSHNSALSVRSRQP